MPLTPTPTVPPPAFWTIFGHSYFQYAFGTRTQMGRADALFRNVLDIEFNNFCTHACAGSMLTKDNNWLGGWPRVYQNVTGSTNRAFGIAVDSAPYVLSRGAYLLGWGINDLGYNGNTTLNNTAYQNAMRAAISRCRISALRDNDYAGAGGTGTIAYGAGFTSTGFTWDAGSGNSWHSATTTTSATVTITLPSDYTGQVVVLSFICDGLTGTGAGGTVTFSGTAGVTGTLAMTQNMPTWANWRSPVVKRITNLTSANASQTIIITATSFGSSGNINFDGFWLEAVDAPPVIVCNTARLTATGYSIYSVSLTASSLSGTAVASTPSTITVNTTMGLSATGSVTIPSGGGTVTISYTGLTDTTMTGCTASGGSGNYSSNTITTPGPSDADVATFNTALASVIAEFDGMVQMADIDSAINKDPTSLGADGLHPSELGAAKIVDAILAATQRLAPNAAQFGRTAQMNPPAPQSASVTRPQIAGLWYGTDGMPNPKGSGTATPTFGYTAVSGDVFAMPFYVTSPDTRWTQWCVELESSTVATTVFMAVYDDKQFRGFPQYAYLQPANFTALTLTTGAGVKLSPTTPTYGFVNSPVDPGLYWVTLKIATAGTTVFNTVSGPSTFLPTLTTAGANPVSSASDPARGNVAWKLAGQGTTGIPTTFTPRGAGFGETLVTVAPKVGLLVG